MSVCTPVGQAVLMMVMVRPCGTNAGRGRTEPKDSLPTVASCMRAEGAVHVLINVVNEPKGAVPVSKDVARGDSEQCYTR